MKHLSEYIHSVDLVRARPAPQVVRHHPEHTLPSVLAVEKEDYSIYIADCREWGEPGAGELIWGELVCDLPEDEYEVACYSPITGQYSPWMSLHGGQSTRLVVPEFRHDIVLRMRIFGHHSPPPTSPIFQRAEDGETMESDRI